MKTTEKFALALGALILGISGDIVSGESAARQCSSEECACEEALRQNTVEALEDFLKRYPQSVNNGESACGALAVPPDSGLSTPEGQSHEDSGPPEEPDLSSSEG
jgi:hypothetical protein